MLIMKRTIQKIVAGSLLTTLLLPALAQDKPVPPASQDSIIVISRLGKGNKVTGTITEAASGKPLVGIRITYKSLSAAITDNNGQFVLKVPDYNISIMAEGEGYQSKEIPLKGQQSITASLYEDSYSSVYDLATMPFETTPKNQIPWSVSSMQTQGAWAQPNETPDAWLQGRAAGLQSIRRSGTPNIGADLYLRGLNSLYATNQPLFVVDGVIFDNGDYGGSLLNNHYTNPLAFIDIKDIDNISVIKDGSASYGTKGANGVVLITTARARELATRIDFATYGGVNAAPADLPVLNANDYRTYLADVLQAKGLTPDQVKALPYMNDDPNHPDYYRYHYNTNWQRQVMKNSYNQTTYLKVTGGDNIARYALSLGYHTNKGVIKGTDLNRYNTRFNADLNLSKRLKAYTNLSFTYNDQKLKDQGLAPKTNPVYLGLIKSPLLPVQQVANDGKESPSLADVDTFNISNPAAVIQTMQGANRNYRFLGSVTLSYLLKKGFSLSSALGITVDKTRESFFIPRKGITNDTLDNAIAESRLGSQVKRLFGIYNDTRLSFNRTIGMIHDIAAHAGFRYLQNQTEQDFGLGANSATDELVTVGNGLNSLRRTGGSIGEWKWLNTYLNADYSLVDRYFLSFNMAIDGSSRFGKKIGGNALTIARNKYAVLPAVAVGWLVSSEGFMHAQNFIELLKLRASYGLSGNDDIGNYTTRQYYVSQNLLGIQGLVRGQFGNAGLQWETVKKLNAGIDLALFNERLNITADIYRNHTSKMVLYEPAPAASGLAYATTNSGAMRTNGVELTVNGRLLNQLNLKWDLGITLSHYKTSVTRLPVDNLITNYAGAAIITQPGTAPNVFYGHRSLGVYESDAAAAGDGYTTRLADGTYAPFKGGDVRFEDRNGDKIIDDNDRTVIGNPNPNIFGAITNHVTWKQWTLDALLSFVQGNDVYNYTRRELESLSNPNNQTTAALNRWRSNGHVTDMPKASWNDPMNNNRFSNRWIEDGSYLRLRSISLSYNIPVNAGGFLKYIVVYATGNNVFTLTKYKGYDPEFSPTESAFGQGIDLTLEPQFRSLQGGIRIGL
jgi:TonB-linked SusC/RagA family outer membrane protein